MHFAWNPRKASQNFSKHNITFEEAMTIFGDPLSATFDDSEHSVAEERQITVGYSKANRLLVVSHTLRGGRIRIISARLATPHERRRHET